MSDATTKPRRKIEHWQMVMLFLIIYDTIAIAGSYFLALWIRFDCQYGKIPQEFMQAYKSSIMLYAVFCVVVFWLLRLYKSIWRFASYSELIRVCMATAYTGLAYTLAM